TGQPLFINIAVGELLKTNGGRLFDAEGRPTLTERPVIELLEFYKKLNRVLPPGWTGHAYLDTFANLANGKAAMLYQAYGRGVGYIEKYAPKDIADPEHFAVADKVIGPSGKTPAAQLDCEPWMVFKDAQGANEAVDFLKFFFKDENYIPYLHSVPIHLLSIKKSTSRNPKYADNAMIGKWRSWIDMQEKYFKNDWIKPVLVTDWDDMRKPYLLEVMGSGILVDMVLDAVKGMPSAEAAAKAQRRVEERGLRGGHDRAPARAVRRRLARPARAVPRAHRDPRPRALPLHDSDDRRRHRMALAPERDVRRRGPPAPARGPGPRADRLARRGPHDDLADRGERLAVHAVRGRERAGAAPDDPARALRGRPRRRRRGVGAVPSHHAAPAPGGALRRRAAALHLDVHEVRHGVALGRGGGGRTRDPDPADLRLYADLHVLPGGIRRGARGDHVRHAHGCHAR